MYVIEKVLRAVRLTTGLIRCPFLHRFQVVSWAHTTSYTARIKDSLPRWVQRPGRESDHLHLIQKIRISGVEPPPPVLRGVVLIKQMDDFNVHSLFRYYVKFYSRFCSCKCLNTCTVRFSIKMSVLLMHCKRSAHRL